MLEPTLLSNMNGGALPPPLRLFWREELYDELAALEEKVLLGHPFPKREPDLDEEEWERVMAGVLEQIPEHETEISAVDLRPLPKSPGAGAFHWRLWQALSVVGGPAPRAIPGCPTANILPSIEVLLPMRLKARLRLVLGCAGIPMVWIRATDLAGVKPPRVRPQRPE